MGKRKKEVKGEKGVGMFSSTYKWEDGEDNPEEKTGKAGEGIDIELKYAQDVHVYKV